ncbi:MAG: helix-hairpin-helix domain-containing protein [Myxococcaceae bacterium]|nr:helix-hairpin-helix domain-containing protein [Myxococcaceae bacterium]
MSVSQRAFATIYESPIVADDEDDLRSAAERGEISDATMQTLLELLADGVDLNTATRDELYELPSLTYADVDAIVEYRKKEGHIEDPSVLVGAGALTAEQLIQIAPFIVLSEAKPVIPIGGYYRLLGAYTIGDPLAPPAFFQAKLRGPFSLTGGLGMTFTRRRISSPYFDPTEDPRQNADVTGTLAARPAGYALEVPKFWLQWKSTKLRVVAGTFRIGFGQRLTLDNTTRYTPKGITPDNVFYVNRDLSGLCRYSSVEGVPVTELCPDELNRNITDDFKWRDPFRGVAFSAENLELGETARASFYAFGSYQTRSIYQYEIYDRRNCANPRDDQDDNCGAPYVYIERPDDPDRRLRARYATLANVWDELAAGGHASFSPIPMFELGLTGYGAMPRWHVPEMQLDFQEYARYPFGGPWGAVGLDGRVTAGAWDFYFEVARSFDSIPGGGGGWGAVQRSVWGKKKRELEITLRFYDLNYVNPYARPVSSPDELEGQRARDEAGIRIKYTDRTLGDFHVRGFVDFWLLPWNQGGFEGQLLGSSNDAVGGYRAGTMNMWALFRADYKGWDAFQPSIWFDYRNRDLTGLNGVVGQPAVGRCYTSIDGRAPPVFEGEPQLCIGERYRTAVQLKFAPFKRKLQFFLTYIHDFLSDLPDTYPGGLSQDVRVTAEVRSQPIPELLLRLRARYLNGDLYSPTRVEESLWTFVEVTWLGWRAFHVTVRYDTYVWLDERFRTRIPNPEHRLRLELEGRF